MMFCSQAEDRTRVQTTAEVAAYWNVGTEANTDGLFQCFTEFGGIVLVRAQRRVAVRLRIVKVPILMELEMLVRRNQVVARRDLEYPIKKSAHLMAAQFDRVVNGLRIPTSWHPGGKQSLHFRS
jgi:5-formyltetrahydrofolate cyclo-ligase